MRISEPAGSTSGPARQRQILRTTSSKCATTGTRSSARARLIVQSIVAVQGLGAHPYYTWVKKVLGPDKIASKGSRKFWKRSKIKGKGQEQSLREVMWPRDLLVPEFKSARVATYSYKSDWRDRQVNTSLRECGQQLLEVLLQHRQDAYVRRCATPELGQLYFLVPHL